MSINPDAEARLRAVSLMSYNPIVEPEEEPSPQVFKFNADDGTTMSFTHYVITGNNGLQEIIPHAASFLSAIQI